MQVTFLTLAYIISVNSNIIADSGGPCGVDDYSGSDKSFGARFGDQGYLDCVSEVRKNLITATAAASMVGTFVMGGFANLPLALAPGMGLNAYFTYNVVGYYGSGSVPYKDALTAVFIEGWIFILLSITGARQLLIKLLPKTLSLSMATGIGLFLAHIGLQASEGLGVVTADGATLVTLGGCDVDYRAHPYYIRPNETSYATVCPADPTSFTADGVALPNLPAPGPNYQCIGGHKLHGAATWLGIAGFAIMVILMSRGFRGAIIVGVMFATIIAWIPGHGASYLGNTSNLPGGIGGTGPSRWSYFKKVVAAPTLDKTGLAFNFPGLGTGEVWIALVTFLYVDFFDTTGTLFSMANFINNFIPGMSLPSLQSLHACFIDDNKNFPRSVQAYCADGLAIVVGSMMGTSPCTTYIESATGIQSGGRTGVTALVVCFYYFLCLFFAPILASIPVFATGPALILVGALMMINVVKIPWEDILHAVPAFLTIVLMPLTYSIAYGVIGGLVAYIICSFTRKALDWGSAHTNGAFGTHNVKEDIEGPRTRERTNHLHPIVKPTKSMELPPDIPVNELEEMDIKMAAAERHPIEMSTAHDDSAHRTSPV
ncbi:hypothetical protein WJX73_004292 [Symbiochloris irregularis]|uniref:Uncharacterized protein n=1 Tax=Symbiochloris irregularis TaxID=706552 RepID=A0AAW1NTF8_9CHLO